jgi:hypothetical protein
MISRPVTSDFWYPIRSISFADGIDAKKPNAFDERRLKVTELEHAAQMGQQRAVDDGDEAPHEEQAGEQRQRRSVVRPGTGSAAGCAG